MSIAIAAEALNSALKNVAFIVGPTGSGKSALAIEVADALGAEIVNADSRQVYRAMDIGTAKPTPAERARVPHHLIDVRSPADPIDAAEFAALATDAIAGIVARGGIPIVVGGSGLYLRAIRGGIFRGPKASPEIRARLHRQARESGTAEIHRRLAQIDPRAAARINLNDEYRIVRALEVFELTGVPISHHHETHAFGDRPFNAVMMAIDSDRERLYENIDRRFDAMIAAGLVAEVRALLDAGYNAERQPMASIGYREIAAYLKGSITLEEAIDRAKRETRRLAKRQLTWFRAEPEVIALDREFPSRHALEIIAQRGITGGANKR
jgi:tRNA dimethylallyltransferase